MNNITNIVTISLYEKEDSKGIAVKYKMPYFENDDLNTRAKELAEVIQYLSDEIHDIFKENESQEDEIAIQKMLKEIFGADF